MKKAVCFVLVFTLLLVFSTPVNAAENSAWLELLETSTVNDSGQNWFKYAGTATVSIPTPSSMRLTKIDMLITYPANTAPTKVEVSYNGTFYNLQMYRIDANTSRVFGDIQQNFYSDVRIRFTRSSTTSTYLEILSCRVSQVVNQEVQAQAQVFVGDTYYTTNSHIEIAGNGVSDTAYSQIRIDVTDWMKFDTVTIWGSATTMALNSVRATISTVGLPFEMSYIESLVTGESSDFTNRYTYTENYSGGGGYGNGYGDINTAMEYNGKILFCITIDLTGVDRTLTSAPLYVYLTGVYSGLYGYTFNCQYVNGSIIVPDKSDAGWWTWGKNMLTSLDELPEKIAEEMGKLFQPDEGKIESVQEQSQQLAEDRLGAVAQAGQVIDGFVGAFQHQTATEYLTVPVLTVPLGEVDWIIGGWTVQVVPDAFKPIVEVLKTVIDIVCTLAFLKSMRARFERMLSGGNA